MVRLKDIAERAGVSIMTVSKALRGERDVSPATRERIKTLAQKMGYVPDSAARGLRSRTSRTLGVIVPSITNPVFARVVRAIEERAHEAGYDLFLAQTFNRTEREEVCIRRLGGRRVDGLLISPVYRIEPEARVYQELLARGTPTVVIGPPAPFCSAFPSVSSDDALAAYHLTRHLLELGHKRIAILTGRLVAPWAQERLDGYRRALREASLDLDDRLIFTAGSTVEDGAKAGLQILNEKCSATAILAVNDLVAVGCANTLLQQGIRIPEDVSVAGFGNIRVGEHFRVPLTTVRQPKYRLGVAALETMLKVLRRDRVEPRRLPAELIIRASTGPARATGG
jgi:LacI family transcriptional regulator